MDNFIKQLTNTAKDTRLSLVEKAAIRSQLLHYAKTHPVNISGFSSHAIASPFWGQSFRNRKTLSAFVIGGLLFGGSVSFAAENTLPGDLLYPVKINVNEQVRGVLAVTPKAKADWDVQRVERRLEEVVKIAVSKNVSPDARVIAERNFNNATDQAQGRIEDFERTNNSKEALATAEKLSKMLHKHEEESLRGEFNNVALSSVIKDVSIARVYAEEKQRKLENNYSRIRSEEEGDGVSRATSTVFLQENNVSSNEYNSENLQKEEHYYLSNPAAPVSQEGKNVENQKREKSYRESSKENSNERE